MAETNKSNYLDLYDIECTLKFFVRAMRGKQDKLRNSRCAFLICGITMLALQTAIGGYLLLLINYIHDRRPATAMFLNTALGSERFWKSRGRKENKKE